MIEVIREAFDPTGFPPRKECGPGWSPVLVSLHAISDLMIWLAYVSIPLVLMYFTRRRGVPHPRLLALFAAFILFCGFTHFVDALIFEWPVYRFAGLLKAATAIISWVTVVALVRVVPAILSSLDRADTTSESSVHAALAPGSRRGPRWPGYVAAVAGAALAVCARAAFDPLLGDRDYVLILPVLPVVYVSWAYGFGPGMTCLVMAFFAYAHLFVTRGNGLAVDRLGDQLALALFFFCGFACAVLGEVARTAHKKARRALAVALARQQELETEVARRRAAEDELRRTTAILTVVNENTPILIYAKDTAGRLTYANPATRAVLGAPDESIIGRTSVDIHGPQRGTAVLANDMRVLHGERVETFEEKVVIGGAERVFFSAKTPARDAQGTVIGLIGVSTDISELKRAQRATAQSEARLRAMANAVPQIVWTTDSGGRVDYFNPRWYEYTGRTDTGSLSDAWSGALHPEDEAATVALWAECVATGREYETEYRLRGRAGGYRWFLARGVPNREADGRVVGWFGSCTDIHDQRTAAERVAEANTFLEATIDALTKHIAVLAPDGTILKVNRAWAEMGRRNGLRLADAGVGSNYLRASEGDTSGCGQDVAAQIRAVIAGARPDFETEYPCHSPSESRWFHLRVNRFPGAGPVRVVVSHEDITARVLLAEALRSAADRFRALTETVPQMVWTADPTGTVTFFNRRWVEYTGVELASGRADGWPEGLIHPEDAAALHATWQAAVAGGADDFTHEFRLRRATDGTYRWMLSVALSRRTPEGTVAEWIGSLTDIDHQKQHSQLLEAEVDARTAALVATNAALEAEVVARAETERMLRATTIELERSNGELEKFAYVASHDLQEPLRKIQAFGDRLKDKCRGELPEPGREYVDRMLNAAGRMRQLISDLLALSRVTTQARPHRRAELGAVVTDALSNLEIAVAQAGATVHVGPLPAVDGDESQLRQLFQNLISNALKFRKRDVPPVVEVTSESADAHEVRVTVRDNGIGFADKYSGRIFEVFQRLHGRDEYEGTGIGLAICKKIVERHGGTITAFGAEGEGARFVMTLPVWRERTRNGDTDEPT